MGTAFPMAEVISTYIPPSFYEAYYLYLYIGSMFFLLYLYMVLLRDKRQMKKMDRKANSEFFSVFLPAEIRQRPPLYYSITFRNGGAGH
ncbi:hypothetical protein HUJ04_006030 [Dendroctonus ponderosae]|nr:hypothetical protein HUJ04_006030 [Dendroctonus ponderosae]